MKSVWRLGQLLDSSAYVFWCFAVTIAQNPPGRIAPWHAGTNRPWLYFCRSQMSNPTVGCARLAGALGGRLLGRIGRTKSGGDLPGVQAQLNVVGLAQTPKLQKCVFHR